MDEIEDIVPTVVAITMKDPIEYSAELVLRALFPEGVLDDKHFGSMRFVISDLLSEVWPPIHRALIAGGMDDTRIAEIEKCVTLGAWNQVVTDFGGGRVKVVEYTDAS